MTEGDAQLDISPVFTGLTRPPMLLGVTMDYLGINIMVALCAFILFFITVLCAVICAFACGWGDGVQY